MDLLTAKAIEEACRLVASRLAKRWFPGSAGKQQQQLLLNTIRSEVVQVIEDEPGLGEISFFEIMHDDRVIAELAKIFDSDDDPDPSRFRDALGAKYDCATLPLAPEAIFQRLVQAIRRQARTEPLLQPLIMLKTTERIAAIGETMVGQMATRADIGRLEAQIRHLPAQEEEIDELRGLLDADYAADVEKARQTLNANRYVQARDLLDSVVARPGFNRTNATTRGEIYRLLGVAYLRLGEYARARGFLDQALVANADDLKSQVVMAELELRLGQPARAAELARSILSRDASLEAAHRILAVAHLESGEIEKARVEMTRAGDADRAANLSVLAKVYEAEAHYDDAVQCLDKALQGEPDDPVLLLQKGALQLKRFQVRGAPIASIGQAPADVLRAELEAARATLEGAVKVWDGHGLKAYSVDVRVQYATVLGLLGETNPALALAQEGTECANANAQSWLTLARCLAEANRLDDAEHAIGCALELEPDMWAAWFLRALICGRRGDYRGGAAMMTEAPVGQWSPDERLSAELLRADMLWEAGEREQGLSLVEQLPSDIRDLSMAVFKRADYLVMLKRAGDAEEVVELGLARSPNDPILLQAAGDVNLAAGNPQVAAHRFARAFRLAPNVRSLTGLGWGLLRLGRFAAVLRLTDHAESRGLHADEFAAIRAACLYGLGRFKEAAETYEYYLERHPDNCTALNNAAICWTTVGQRQRAIRLLERLAALDVDDWEVCGRLAELHMAEGNRENAFRSATEALRRAPEVPEAHLLFARIGFDTGHGRDAVPAMASLLERFPTFPGLQRKTIEEAAQVMRDARDRGQRIHQDYRARKIPIAVAASLLQKPLALYRVVLRRAGASFLADAGDPDSQQSGRDACRTSAEAVVDYSALLTLAQCDILNLVQRRFNRIYISSDVRAQIQADRTRLTERLGYLQSSCQKRVRDKLAVAQALERWQTVESDILRWPPDWSAQDAHLCERTGASYLVDRVRDDERDSQSPRRCVTVQGFVTYLWDSGALDRHKYEKAVAFLSETGNWSSTNEFPLGGLRSPLVVSWPALSTLEAIGLLDWALEQIPDLYVSPLTVQDLNADATEEALYEEALSLVSRIEQELDRKDGIFLVVAGSQSEPHGAPSWQADMGIALAKGVALWTDDLVIRMLHVHGTTGARAFSTRCLIERLGESGVVGDDQQHQLTLDLMRIGFDYCWFKAETLVWSARQHNYRSNDDTEALIAHRGNPDSFDNVAAQAIALLAESYDARREPRLDELGHWMRHLSNATAEGWAFITERFIVRVTQLLSRRSRSVQLRWMTLVKNWTDLGRIRPQRGRIQVVSLSPPIWRPDQGTWQ